MTRTLALVISAAFAAPLLAQSPTPESGAPADPDHQHPHPLVQRPDSGPTAIADVVQFSGIFSAAWQHESVRGARDREGGSFIFQPEVVARASERTLVRARFGFAADDALNNDSPFASVQPWAADTESGVNNINGRSRDAVIIAEVTHAMTTRAGELTITGGVLDPTEFLDENAFANDELSQFMNLAFVNDPIANLPTYDVGAAVRLDSGDWQFTALGQRYGSNGIGRSFTLWGGQAMYHFGGEDRDVDNVRLTVTGTSSDFADPTGASNDESQIGVSVSVDHRLLDCCGVFSRLSWGNDDPARAFDRYASAGFAFNGSSWGREHDVVGVGLGYLDGGNTFYDDAIVGEIYGSVELVDTIVLTADAQYVDENVIAGAPQRGVDGWILGLRVTMTF